MSDTSQSWTETSESESSIPDTSEASPLTETRPAEVAPTEDPAEVRPIRAPAEEDGQTEIVSALGEAPMPPLAGLPPRGLGSESEPPRALARQSSGGVMVYATVAGAAAVIPVPFVDSFVGKLARGSAMRRVAQRRGVRLTPEARDVLARPGIASRLGTAPARLLRSAITQALAPLRIASRVEDSGATFLAAVLLDHYLLTSERRPGIAMSEHEAQIIRDAMEASWAEMGLETLRAMPVGFFEVVSRALRAAVQPDTEGRGPIERLVDALLDGAADAPEDLLQSMRDQFDRAIAARRQELDR